MKLRSAPFLILTSLCLFFAVLLAAPYALAQQESVIDFSSVVEVAPDSSITVTETITVQAHGREIKRGIFRWLYTLYKGDFGQNKTVRYDILSVERDGQPEPWHVEDKGDKLVVYMGHKDVFLEPGQYTYTLKYKSWRQVGYFEEFDELYWNVTGNYWSFPILHASCVVRLPEGTPVIRKMGYTGESGDSGDAYRASIDGNGDAVFETTAPLQPGEGFTIAVAWPKGIVYEPTDQERFIWYFQDNRPFLVGVGGLVVVFVYYMFVWFRVGRDPARWTIVPLFEPPKGFSPAATRFVMRMGYDNKAFAAALIDMAVKGHVRIEEEKVAFSTVYTLTKLSEDTSALSNGERAVSQALFASRDSIELRQKNNAILRKALKALKTRLKIEYEKVYFMTNAGYLVPGLGLSLAILLLIAFSARGENRYAALFMTIWLSMWTVGCVALVLNAFKTWKGGRTFAAMFMTLFTLPFLAGEIMGLFMYSQATSIPAALCLVALVGLTGLFYQLLKAPTFAGRRLMDEIEGFKLFLSISEKERMELLHPPEHTPQLFEKYLPYALALDVENQWSEQFSDVLARAGAEQGYAHGYHPHWYHGDSWNSLGAAGFAGSLGSAFSSAVGSASSTSGSGGGGSSGGGGGGGGGGGW